MGNFGMGYTTAALLPLPAQKKSPSNNNYERKRLQIKIIRSLHGIKRGYPQEKFLRAYAKVVEGSENYFI